MTKWNRCDIARMNKVLTALQGEAHTAKNIQKAFLKAKHRQTLKKCTKLNKCIKKPKKRNTRKQGQKYVNEAMEEYNDNGWLTWKPGNKAVFLPAIRKVVSQSQDILTVADFLAIKADDKVHFVQVTTATQGSTSHSKPRQAKMDALPFNMEHVVLVVMARVRGGGWRIWRKDELGWAEVAMYAKAR